MKKICFFLVFPFKSKGLDLDKFPGNKISSIFWATKFLQKSWMCFFFWMLGKRAPEIYILPNDGEK